MLGPAAPRILINQSTASEPQRAVWMLRTEYSYMENENLCEGIDWIERIIVWSRRQKIHLSSLTEVHRTQRMKVIAYHSEIKGLHRQTDKHAHTRTNYII